jgi:AsmA family protein
MGVMPGSFVRTNAAAMRYVFMAPAVAPTPTHRIARVSKWAGIIIGGLLVVLLITLAVLDANADALRGPLARYASAHLGRKVSIDGKLQLHLLSWRPRAVIRQLRIANPDWVQKPADMARIGNLEVSWSFPALLKGDILLPYVGVDDSDIDVVRDSKERLNWSFGGGSAKQSAKPAKFPILGSLHVGPGHLVVSDQVRKLKFTGTLTADQASRGGGLTLSLAGDGTINDESFKLAAKGDPLITAETHKPYTVESTITAGRTKVKSSITVTKPFDMGSVVADIDASGDDLADLYYLSGLALPNTAPYTVSGHVQRNGSRLDLTNFKGTLGNSDIHGKLSLETAGDRPMLTADLQTRLLDIKDLGPTLGSRAKVTPSSLSRKQAQPGSGSESAEESSAKARAAAQPKSAQTRTAEAVEADSKAAKGQTLLPDAKLDLKRVRGMDANVKYHAESVKTEKMSIREILLDLHLDQGIMTFTPVSFVLPQGKLTSNIRVDGAKDVPEVEIDARLTQVRLSQFKTKDGQEPLDGTLVGRAILHGRGKSLHEIGSTAAGTLSIAVPHGDIRSAFAELLGINAARGLGLLLAKNEEKTGIRCGVANFKAEGGVFAAQDIVIDTDNVLILGKGQVDLGPESLDLTFNGQPKKPRLFRIKSPIQLGGTLEKPKVGLNAGNTPGQVAIATALGVLATPLASVLAFIDPGLAKDADCSALLTEGAATGHAAAEG